MYILKVYSIHYTLRSNKNVQKNPSDKINVTKNALFFLSRAPTHHSFTFNLHKVCLSKTVCGIFHFLSVSFLLELTL